MDKDLLQKLRLAGFPQKNKNWCEDGCAEDDPKCLINVRESEKPDYEPNLDELIDACQASFKCLRPHFHAFTGKPVWEAVGEDDIEGGVVEFKVRALTKREAVARLYLKLQVISR